MRKFVSFLLIGLMLLSTSLAEKSVVMTFTGDVTLGSEEAKRNKPFSFDTMLKNEGYEYFLKNVRDFFAQDDCTVVNLEGVLSNSSAQENKKKTYRFRGPVDFIQVLTTSSVEAASLANNHTMDFGKQGYNSTLETVRAAGLGAFGTQNVFIFEKDGIRIAFFSLNSTAYNGNKQWAKEEIARLKSEEGVNAVVFLFHAGQEYGMHRVKAQETYAHTMIDAGADLIIMHHPHVVQGVEIYKNRTICYSLGNFCFGGNKTVRALQALVSRVTFTFDDNNHYTGQQVELYPAHISGTDPDSNYQPLLVRGEAAQEVMRLVQLDTDFDLPPLQEDTGASSLPYLPAESLGTWEVAE